LANVSGQAEECDTKTAVAIGTIVFISRLAANSRSKKRWAAELTWNNTWTE
jgi:hypothetical protein